MNADAIPILVVFAGTVIVVMAAIELGNRLGQVMHRRGHDDKDSTISTMSGAILGLAAFMLAFTFAIVSERYDTRKGWFVMTPLPSALPGNGRTFCPKRIAARQRRCCGSTSICA